jgi:hypothetical protein
MQIVMDKPGGYKFSLVYPLASVQVNTGIGQFPFCIYRVFEKGNTSIDNCPFSRMRFNGYGQVSGSLQTDSDSAFIIRSLPQPQNISRFQMCEGESKCFPGIPDGSVVIVIAVRGRCCVVSTGLKSACNPSQNQIRAGEKKKRSILRFTLNI